ncbi:hypothetical protein E2C01_000063 [Portunus trituberculatus]|uniref:Uncharacterized protein n=1 Tax=Portunus trituberculatus TaxID=210409 RepID=A0A5B7CD45_PORTR|nr:hypothetical protein [Portunus trituberculatus]
MMKYQRRSFLTHVEGRAQECLQLDERQQDLWTAAFFTQPTMPRILNPLTDGRVDGSTSASA